MRPFFVVFALVTGPPSICNWTNHFFALVASPVLIHNCTQPFFLQLQVHLRLAIGLDVSFVSELSPKKFWCQLQVQPQLATRLDFFSASDASPTSTSNHGLIFWSQMQVNHRLTTRGICVCRGSPVAY